MENKKHRVSFDTKEIYVLAHLTRHFCDYMFGDDRPDHGLGILKGYREAVSGLRFGDERPEHIESFLSAMGKLNRLDRKIRFK